MIPWLRNRELEVKDLPSIHSLSFKSLQGKEHSMSEFKGKFILIVNVASKCGFTPQYADLQELHNKFGDKLAIIGFPSNQFANQEPGSAEEIETFCTSNYGVSFLMAEKVDVMGDQQHPIYAWLTQKEKNGKDNNSVKWNFQKYLIDPEGRWVDVFYSITKPMSQKILKHLAS